MPSKFYKDKLKVYLGLMPEMNGSLMPILHIADPAMFV